MNQKYAGWLLLTLIIISSLIPLAAVCAFAADYRFPIGNLNLSSHSIYNATNVNATSLYASGSKACTVANMLCGSASVGAGWTNTTTMIYTTDINDLVGIGDTTPDAQLDVQSSSAETKGLIVQGATSQSANLQEWTNSGGTPLSYITATGAFSTSSCSMTATYTSCGSFAISTSKGAYFGSGNNNGYIPSGSSSSQFIAGVNANLTNTPAFIFKTTKFLNDTENIVSFRNVDTEKASIRANGLASFQSLAVTTVPAACSVGYFLTQWNGTTATCAAATAQNFSIGGGWTNTSVMTTTTLNVNITGISYVSNVTLGTDKCVKTSSGGKLCGNSTCTTLYSPNGLSKVEACN